MSIIKPIPKPPAEKITAPLGSERWEFCVEVDTTDIRDTGGSGPFSVWAMCPTGGLTSIPLSPPTVGPPGMVAQELTEGPTDRWKVRLVVKPPVTAPLRFIVWYLDGVGNSFYIESRMIQPQQTASVTCT